jgi:hypothetical protein
MKKNITFGGKPTRDDQAAMATKRGYDTGKPSTGSKPAPKATAKPVIEKGKVGIKITKKV